MNNLLAIVGPTAVGKTRLAVELKKELDSGRSLPRTPLGDRNDNYVGAEHVPPQQTELISVDSRQVYSCMDIGTGKDAKIFGTDLTRPDKLFSVVDYCRAVKPHIEKLWQENKLPILVGGTGLYLKALIDGIDTIDVPPNEELRKKYEHASVSELQKLLVSMYPYMNSENGGQRTEDGIRKTENGQNNKDVREQFEMNNSDWNNPRRLIRRIEILTAPPQAGLEVYNCKPLQINNLLIIGLTASLSIIKKNIELRVRERLNKGLLEEIKGLVQEYGWNVVLKNTIAYKEWEDYFAGKISKEAAIERWILDEVQYAKRQLTWFKKDRRVVWLEKDYLKRALQIINNSHLLD